MGRRLCQNVTKGKLINDFLEKSVALTGLGMLLDLMMFSPMLTVCTATNLWSQDNYFLPPCTSHRYSVYTLKQREG